MRILVVEDERALCDAIARSLRNLAYSVDCCYDALGEVVKGVADCLLDDHDSAQAVLAALDAVYGPDTSDDAPTVKGARALAAYTVALRAVGLL